MANTPKVLVYGASGHGKVVAEIVRASGFELAGFIDDGVPPGTGVLGVLVEGGFAWLERTRPEASIALGIGVNATRLQVAQRVAGLGLALGTYVHPRAWVSPSARLGAGVVVMANAVVNAEAVLEDGVILNTGAVVEHDCVIERFAHISPNAALGGGVHVGACAHVGLGASVRPLARIGRDCVVGAGAAVLREVPDGAVVAGVPARLLR